MLLNNKTSCTATVGIKWSLIYRFMEYRQMGKWGLRLSCLGLGSYLTIGFKCDEETSRELVRTAYENGINFFDTANAY